MERSAARIAVGRNKATAGGGATDKCGVGDRGDSCCAAAAAHKVNPTGLVHWGRPSSRQGGDCSISSKSKLLGVPRALLLWVAPLLALVVLSSDTSNNRKQGRKGFTGSVVVILVGVVHRVSLLEFPSTDRKILAAGEVQ